MPGSRIIDGAAQEDAASHGLCQEAVPRMLLMHQLRSGAGVLGSSPRVALALGVLVVLVLVRLASLLIPLKELSEAAGNESRKEAPMRCLRTIASVICETVWAFGVSVGAGLLLLS